MKQLSFTFPSLLLAGLLLVFMYNQPVSNSKPRETEQQTPFQKLSPAQRTLFFAEYEFDKTKDPATNALPRHIKARELAFAKRLNSGTAARSGSSQNWNWVGPNNVSGRVLDLAVDVTNTNVLLAGSASGGLWKSPDNGLSWEKKTAPNVVQSVTSIVQNKRPGKTNVWYYGTGELLSTTDRQFSTVIRTLGYGNGIYKSTDSGENWEVLEATTGGIDGTLSNMFQGVWKLAIDNSDPVQDVLYAACLGGILRSDDDGASWSLVLGDPNIRAFGSWLEIASDGTIYAALSSVSTSPVGFLTPVNGIWKSTDGITWTKISTDLFPTNYMVVKFDVSQTDPAKLFAITENYLPPDPSDDVVGYTACEHKLLVYENGAWTDRTQNLPGGGSGNIIGSSEDPLKGNFNSNGGYCLTIKIHETQDNVVFLGGTNLYRNTAGFTDSTATAVLGGYPYDGAIENLHPDLHALSFKPGAADQLFACTDGGVFQTPDCLADTVAWNYRSDNMVTTQFYWVATDPAGTDDMIVGGVQDNGSYLFDALYPPNSGDWEFALGGDGLTSLIAPNKAFFITSVYGNNIFSFELDSNAEIKNMIYQTPDTMAGDRANFFTHFVLDPNDSKTFYMPARNFIWRKADMAAAAKHDSLVAVGWQKLDNTLVNNTESITTINISNTPADILFYGTDKGKVYKMPNAKSANPVPEDITSANFPKNAFVACVEVDPENADRIFAVFSNYNVPSIFYSADGGQSWTDVSGNLEEYPNGSGAGPSVRYLEILHFNGVTQYFAATSVGLFSTTELNGAATQWSQEGQDNIGSVIVDQISARALDGFVAIATQGNGVYTTNFTTTGLKQQPIRNVSAQVWPVPAQDILQVQFENAVAGKVQMVLFDLSGRQLHSFSANNYASGVQREQLDISGLGTGVYILKISTRAGLAAKKIIISK